MLVIVTSPVMSEDSILGSSEPEPSSNLSGALTDYEYKPLTTSPATIRLIEIKSPSSVSLEEPLFCEIHHFDLKTAASMDYCALSYVWGEPIRDQTVTLSKFPFKVTSHLYKALQRLRFFGWKLVWIDAICIDQSNIPERNAQVTLMGRIYSSAQSTAIYLGETDKQGARAVGLMTHLYVLEKLLPDSKAGDKLPQLTHAVLNALTDHLGSGHVYVKQYKRKNLKQSLRLSDGLSGLPMARSMNKERGLRQLRRRLRVLNLPKDGNPLWATLRNIYQSPWFTRGWVVQEAVLSHRAMMILGQNLFEFERLEFSLFFIIKSKLHEHAIIRLPRLVLMPMTIKMIREESEYRNLLRLLRVLHLSRTTDPRDKIYCLLGLADDIGTAPTPDYSQSVEEVYRTFAVHFIKSCEGLSILRNSGTSQGARVNATWVPRWDRWSHARVLDGTLDGSFVFQASGSLQAHFEYEEDNSLLKVRGVYFDQVGRFCSQTFSSKTHKDWISWEKSISSTVQQSPMFSAESYARTLDLDKNGLGIGGYSKASANRGLTFEDHYKSVFVTDSIEDRDGINYFNDIRTRAKYYRFVLTTRGYLGWVPKESEISDTICVILGVSIPLVLREVENGRHILIGSAYIDGIMRGEAVKSQDVVVEDFTLT